MIYTASKETLDAYINPDDDMYWLPNDKDDLIGYKSSDDKRVDRIYHIPKFYRPSAYPVWNCVTYRVPDNVFLSIFDQQKIKEYIDNHSCDNIRSLELIAMPDDLRRIINYKTRPVVIAICGPSGCGKTSLSIDLKDKMAIPYLVSYTTRPMRDGETNGKEHWFVTEDETPPSGQMLAYTYFGNHHYWTDIDDIKGKDYVTYTIDERGLLDLYDMKKEGRIDVIYVQIERPDNPTDPERMERDKIRAEVIEHLKERNIVPDITILNNYPNAESFLEFESRELYNYIWKLKTIKSDIGQVFK